MLNRIIERALQLIGGRKKFRVTFNRGRREAFGFQFYREAKNWARLNCAPGDWVIDEVESIDLRILPEQKMKSQIVDGRRVRWVG